jgi:alpha/beta superfamily hydrolase
VARRIETHFLPGPAGVLEALLEEPEGAPPRHAALLCHPHPLYGGTMHNKVVYRLARGMRAAGMVVLRFNFRGVGRSQGQHGKLAGEIEDARAALGWLRGRYPDLPFSLAGFSFGARVITRLGCSIPGASRLIAAGFPTRMSGADYLRECSVPITFIQSTQDEHGPRAELVALVATLSGPVELIWVEARDHFFAGGLDRLEDAARRVFEAG